MNTTTLVQSDGTTYIYILDQATLNELSSKLTEINSLTDIQTGGTYYVYESIGGKALNPNDPTFKDLHSAGATEIKYYKSNENETGISLAFMDELTQIFVALALVGLIIGLLGGGWTLLILAILVIIVYYLLKDAFKTVFNDINNTIKGVLPKFLREASPELSIFIIAIILFLIFYLFRKAQEVAI